MPVLLLTLIVRVLPWARRPKDERGISLIEYALLLLLIVIVAILALVFLGNATNNSLNDSTNTLFNH